MCFSAGASFAGGVLLTGIGVATAKKVKDPSQRLFASIPAFFAIQQFTEGFVWLSLRNGGSESMLTAASYAFLLFALVIWPAMIPLSMLKMEENTGKRFWLKILSGTGSVLSVYYLYCLVRFNVNPAINGFHIQYVNDFPKQFGIAAFSLYVIVTIAPLFISSVRRMHYFGVLIFLSCLVTGVFYREYLTSVWCFFAALISAVIYLIVAYSHESENILSILTRQNNNRLSHTN